MEPTLEQKDSSDRLAACHFPLTDEEGRRMTSGWTVAAEREPTLRAG